MAFATEEVNAVRVRDVGESTGALDHVAELLVLRRQSVGAGKAHLTREHDRSLKIPVRLLEDEHIVVRLEQHLWSFRNGGRQSRRTQILSIGAALEEIRGVE
jgi:hypothetical protein